jgi:hypothetical protein
MAFITVQYFARDDLNTLVGSTILRLTPDNKLSVSFLEKEFKLRTVKEIENGVIIGIVRDERGVSLNSFVPNTTVKITGEPEGKVKHCMLIVYYLLRIFIMF